MAMTEEEKIFDVEISARHLHLTQDVVDILFGKGYQLVPAVPTPGQFCSTARAAVVGPKHTYERVAIMGPCRNFNQFELSLTDARQIGMEVPIRMSGDIEGTPGIKIVGPEGEVVLDKGVIVAKRHIHMNPLLAEELGIKDGDAVMMKIESEQRTLIFDDTIARISGSPKSKTTAHIDTDEGNAAGVMKKGKAYVVK